MRNPVTWTRQVLHDVIENVPVFEVVPEFRPQALVYDYQSEVVKFGEAEPDRAVVLVGTDHKYAGCRAALRQADP